MTRTIRALTFSVAVLAGAVPSVAQSQIDHAKIERQPAGNLAATVARLTKQPGPAWIAYAVAAQRPGANACCGDWSAGCCRSCQLETGRQTDRTTAGTEPASGAPILLEGDPQVTILLRVADGAIGKVRAFSSACRLDAGGLPVHWLEGVQMAESVALLETLADAPDDERGGRQTSDGALLAISMHGDPSADRALGRLMQPGRAERIRKQAAFWAAQARGRAGFDLVRTALNQADAEDRFRRHAVFALSQSREPDATAALIALAREDRSSQVRAEALFWLAQKAGARAASAISDAIANDPDTKVKERAVFALSQLPDGQGVPRLIEVARTNTNPAVRRRAMFWLGQSRDPRALKFFEEVLK